MAISEKGLELIRHFEGLRLDAYRDPVDVWTIGYGHTRTAKEGMTISVQQAVALLEKDLAGHEKTVDKAVTADLGPEQRSALVSFAFNVGDGNFLESTLLKRLNDGRTNDVGAQFERWIYGTKNGRKVVLPGLVRRRKAERKLFESGALDVFATRAQGRTRDEGEEDLEGDFGEIFETWGVRNFKAHELLIMGSQHSNADSPAFGLNTLPPSRLWSNVSYQRASDVTRMGFPSPFRSESWWQTEVCHGDAHSHSRRL